MQHQRSIVCSKLACSVACVAIRIFGLSSANSSSVLFNFQSAVAHRTSISSDLQRASQCGASKRQLYSDAAEEGLPINADENISNVWNFLEHRVALEP
jgi:hypothetical protein